MQQAVVEIKENYAGGGEAISVNKTGDWRFLTPTRTMRLSPCRQSCLLDSEIPSWFEAVKQQNWAEAWTIMRRYNPFPAITGHVCYSPCHGNCNRGQLDQGIDIRQVEKAIGYWRLENYRPPSGKIASGKKVAIIGSGPAGLSCAYYLVQAGYRATVYERSDQIGGLLALGIPEYRLPRKILAREISILEAEGVVFRPNQNLGSDFQLEDLTGQYDQVFLATGAWIPRFSGIAGEKHVSVFNALDFLVRYNRGTLPNIGRNVIVVGGGNAAIDSARSALRVDGVQHVCLIYRRSRIEMPADQHEVEAAEHEGVEFIFNVLPRKINIKDGKVRSVLLDHSKTDRNGLVVKQGNSLIRECDAVVMALGQTPDYSVFGKISKSMHLFAGGDLVTGPATVPEAIRAGCQVALAIRAQHEDPPPAALDDQTAQPAVSFEELNLAALVNLELKKKEANPVAEAKRCLGCGTCNSCGICYLFCPDLAVTMLNSRFEFNLDYCKGCGICAKECPAQALIMEGGGI